MLKYFPGKLEWLGTAVIPVIAILVLLLLPFLDRNQKRHYSKRKIALTVMGVVVVGIVGLTIIAAVTTPPQEPLAAADTIPEQIAPRPEPVFAQLRPMPRRGRRRRRDPGRERAERVQDESPAQPG